MNELSIYLKKLRDNKRLSQTEVATGAGISDSVLSHLENNKTKLPNPFELKKLAQFYNIDISTLYIKAGYLDEPIGNNVFSNVENLSSEEVSHIQQLINLFNENRLEKR